MHVVTEGGALGSLGRGVPEFPVTMEKNRIFEEGWLDSGGLAAAGSQNTLEAVNLL